MFAARAATYTVNGNTLVEGIDLALVPGKLIAIVGPNGAGKSTLLRLLSGEIAPTAGSVELDGRPLQAYSPAELARRRAVVAQSTVLSFPFTVREVVLLGASVPGFVGASREAERMATACIARVGMDRLEHRLFTQLSGGERQRVQIARALLQLAVANLPADTSSALLLDEPTSSLDLAHQGVVLEEAQRQARNGLAVLSILHDLNLAAAFADELVLISAGRIAARGPASEVLRDDLLSRVYRCRVRANATPPPGVPFVLPHAAP
jgi:iron complex transport system ATP-binding protein